MILTNQLRWLKCDGALVLQQWHECEGYEHPEYLIKGGEWRNVPIEDERPKGVA